MPQIKNKRKIHLYLADAGQAIYENHRTHCGRKNLCLVCKEFISYACAKVRRNTKKQHVRANKKKLGTSIEERPFFIDSREEFGHWEIDTVIGEKSGNDSVLLTMAEQKTRQFIVRKISSKSAVAVMTELDKIREECGTRFSSVFKTIIGDNGSEFADLSTLEQATNTKIYFTHPYSSFEKGTNERRHGLIRRFLPKGTRMSECNIETMAFVEDWCNTCQGKY